MPQKPCLQGDAGYGNFCSIFPKYPTVKNSPTEKTLWNGAENARTEGVADSIFDNLQYRRGFQKNIISKHE